MDFIDYYKILEVDKTASADNIKKAYRKLARKHHPDLNPKDKEAKNKFQQINEANEVLGNVEKRKKYDQFGEEWQHAEQFDKHKQQQQSQQSQYQNAQPFGGDGESDFSSFFEYMFGSAQKGSQTKFKGQDYEAELKLNLLDAMKTHKETINVNGKNIRITIPAGIENNQKIKLIGYGATGSNGGPSGDLYITFNIAPHTDYKRLKNDLYATVNLDFYTALLGGETTIDTLTGKVKLKVNPETQQGTKLRLKGKGFPIYKKENEYGDLYITYQIVLPTKLNQKQK
jgi:curved DNA-binding protein